MWSVYILYSPATRRTYTGITTDPVRRLLEHNGRGKHGAKATRAGRPWLLRYLEPMDSKSAALKKERSIKKLCAPDKLLLLGMIC